MIHGSVKKSVQSVDSSFNCNDVGEVVKFLSERWYLNHWGYNGNVVFGPWLWILQLLPWVLDRNILEASQRKLRILLWKNHINDDALLKVVLNSDRRTLFKAISWDSPCIASIIALLTTSWPMLDRVYRWMRGINHRHRWWCQRTYMRVSKLYYQPNVLIFGGYMKVRDSLYTWVIIWVNTILNHGYQVRGTKVQYVLKNTSMYSVHVQC